MNCDASINVINDYVLSHNRVDKIMSSIIDEEGKSARCCDSPVLNFKLGINRTDRVKLAKEKW